VCVEAAGQQAVRDHAERVLRSGCNFLCTSIGVLTDDAFKEVSHTDLSRASPVAI
jgi:predicted dinucleotide-utilizing enzyme